MVLPLVVLAATAFLGVAGTALAWKPIGKAHPHLPPLLFGVFGLEEIAFLVLAAIV